MKKNFKLTVLGCYLGYISQAIVNTFPTLLFVMFSEKYDLPLSMVGLLITINFATQLVVDMVAAKFADTVGYRKMIVFAHVSIVAGLMLYCFLPEIMNPFAGLCVSVVLCAIGGGITEVLITPILEACPSDDKRGAMSLLHSFYCWGCMAVVLVSTLMFKLLGMANWFYVAVLWALVPLFNVFLLSVAPMNSVSEEGKTMTIAQLFKAPLFWILAMMIFASGASEQAMSQWASAFAESALNISKTAGDIAGPCMFAFLMGIGRLLHSKIANRISLEKYLSGCAFLCIAGYLIASFSPVSALSLTGCALCGFAVAAMWPGTFSLAAEKNPMGGTAMFGLLALAGDVGCGSGPTIVGFVSRAFGENLKTGLAFGIVFPLLLIVSILLCNRFLKKERV